MSSHSSLPEIQVKPLSAPIERSFSVCTPTFGGGVFIDPKQDDLKGIDAVTPIRVSSIIGQLRFWWRAIEGVRYPHLEALRDAEGAMWGTQTRPGWVTLWVKGQPKVEKLQTSRSLKYATFSLKGKTTYLQQLKGEVTLYARLSGKAPDDARATLELVLDAWLHLGGVAGRTRRGFGAVAPARSHHDLEEFLSRVAARRPDQPQFHSLLPTLHGAEAQRSVMYQLQRNTERDDGQKKGAHRAHEHGVQKLMEFRQGEDLGRRKGSDPSSRFKLGRSFWPEPDEVRRRVGTYDPRHKPVHTGRGFPRAQFGMPLIIDFRGVGERAGEPSKQTIQPQRSERMASPLIIRPLKLQGGYRCLALRLHVPDMMAERYVIKSNKAEVSIDLTNPQSVRAMVEHDHRDSGDPIEAFLNYFSK